MKTVAQGFELGGENLILEAREFAGGVGVGRIEPDDDAQNGRGFFVLITEDGLAIIAVERVLGIDALAVGFVQEPDELVVKRLGHGTSVFLAIIAPVANLAEGEQADQVQKRGRRLGELEGLMFVAGFKHVGALFKTMAGNPA